MGTSASQASPRSGPSATSWAAVAAGYRSPEVPLERVVKEIWRAAQSGEEANWRVLLRSAGVRLCFDTASTAESPQQALATATREISRSRQSSIAVDVAKRALVQGFSVSGDVRRGFVEALFGQVTSYLISRDLAGHVGDRFRNRRVSDAIEFKKNVGLQVRREIAGVIEEMGLPEKSSEASWSRFLDTAVTRLAG
jgi:hypothetical protein